MPYITVRNTPISSASRRENVFEKSRTYIDYQGSAEANGARTLGTELRSRLRASLEGNHDLFTPRDTVTHSTDRPPHVVFNVLEGLGYKVVAAITINQTAVWTLHKQE